MATSWLALLCLSLKLGVTQQKSVDYYLAQHLADSCVAGEENCKQTVGQGTDLPAQAWSLHAAQEDGAPADPVLVEPPENYPKQFYCGAGRRLRRTTSYDWRPARQGNASKTTARIIALGDWGATTCPHETYHQFIQSCVRFIRIERKRGRSWTQIYSHPGYLRCGSLHHRCSYESAMWGTADCDPSTALFWKHTFAQYTVADQMAATARSVGGIDFVLSVGDNFYLRGVVDEADLNWRYMYEEVYHHEELHVPWLSVLGNHDYGGHECDGCLFEGGTGGCSTAQMDYDNNKSWSFPAEKQKRWVLPAAFYKKHFSFDDFDIDVFAINSNRVNTASMCGGQAKVTSEAECNEAQCQRFFAEQERKQRAWLEEELGRSQAHWKWVVAHHPCEALGQEFMTFLAKNNVSLVFAGHVHQLRLDKVGSIHCVVTGAGGGYQWNGGGHPSYTIRHTGHPEYGFVLVEASRDQLALRYLNDRGEPLWQDVSIPWPPPPEKVKPSTADDKKDEAAVEAEEDGESDDGVACEWGNWEDGSCSATCGVAYRQRIRKQLTVAALCEQNETALESCEDLEACPDWGFPILTVGCMVVAVVLLGLLTLKKRPPRSLEEDEPAVELT